MSLLPRSILCFGDSNTHGTAPMTALGPSRRWPFHQRWPGVLQGLLGADWRVIEEGLPGRTIGRDDPVEGADRNALRWLPACLASHRPLDAVVFLLGVNDLKARFQADAAAVAAGVHGLVDAVQLDAARSGMALPRLLVISPPPARALGCLAPMFSGAEARGQGLGEACARVAAARGVDFIDGGSLARVCDEDGVHLDVPAHQAIGRAVARWVCDGEPG